MEIKSYLYRKPDYLAENNLDMLDTIVIHHTGNNNSIDTNTDYHMDHNGWSYNGYGYYIHNGEILKVRGYKYRNAAVTGHNEHTINIAIQGDYNSKLPSQQDMEALQYCIDHIKKELPQIKYLKRHNDFGDTSCPGKLFPFNALKLNEIEYVTKAEFDELQEQIRKQGIEIELIKNVIDRRIR